MNSFINSQGFAKIGMMTVLLGAIANIILDPIFIFGLAFRESKALRLQLLFHSLFLPYGHSDFLTGQKTILKIKKSKVFEFKSKTCDKDYLP